jgi:hypothetical protein
MMPDPAFGGGRLRHRLPDEGRHTPPVVRESYKLYFILF